MPCGILSGVIRPSLDKCDGQRTTEGADRPHLSHYISHGFHYGSLNEKMLQGQTHYVDRSTERMK